MFRTTTMEILSGDIFPTKGGALLGGYDIMTEQLKVRRLIGYCPQFDAIFGLLTAREHLEFYARIKQVKEENLKEIVDGMIHYLSLEEHADRPAGTYSGGNKRKLSVAMALIGDPPIVFLDGKLKTFAQTFLEFAFRTIFWNGSWSSSFHVEIHLRNNVWKISDVDYAQHG
jgi:ABC-type multidrug transport system ATPase subunit